MKFLLVLFLWLPLSAWANQDADFLAIRDAYRKGDRVQLEKRISHFPKTALEPYLTYYQLRLDWDAPEKQLAIKSFLLRSQDSPIIDAFRNDWLKHLASQQRWKEFADEYPRRINEDGELACHALQYRHNMGESGALGEAKKKWLNGNELPQSCETLFSLAIAKGLINEHDLWARLRLSLETGNLTLARRLIAQLPAKHSTEFSGLEMAANNPLKYLTSLKSEKRHEGERLLSIHALIRLAKQSPMLAFEHWQKIASLFPESERHYFYGQLGYTAARQLDENALGWFKAAEDIELSEQQLAWRTRAALRAGDWHEVWGSINSMSPQQQRDAAWRYWKARALRALGRPHAAESLLAEQSREYNFYGQLAAEELGISVASTFGLEHLQLEHSEIEKMARQPAVQRVIALYGMDLRNDAAKEWSWFCGKLNDRELLIAAEVARRNEMIDRAIHAADRTSALHDFNLRYPAPYRESLREHVTEFGLDEAWVYGLMRQESRFVTQAKSNVGAAGLMQIMPATARWVARKLNMSHYRNDLIHQLDVNLKLGTFYMKNVLNSLDSNPVLASAAYNAGPGRARHWRGNRPLEGAIYAETIPFDETRDYVKKVMSNTSYYARLFGQPPQSLKQRLGIIAARTVENQRALADER